MKRVKNRSSLAGRNAAAGVTVPSNENISPDPATSEKASSADAFDRVANPPNIKYTGRPRWDKGKKKRLDYNAPIEQFSDRGRVIELPSPSAQEKRRVFYHEDAATIAEYFPHLYKLVRSK